MNIGLVLSGGMAKGAYQVGVLRALAEVVPMEDIRCISCASIGVLNGYAFAVNNLQQAEYMWKTVVTNHTRLMINQILRSSLLQQNIANIYLPNATLSTPFYCTLFDMTERNIIYKDLSVEERDSLPQYLKASVAMPIYNRAVSLNGRQYFDGAMIDNIPVYPLLKHQLDYIIAVYFDGTCYQFENPYFDSRIIKITFPAKSIVKQSLVFEQETIQEMISNGYDRASYILNSVFSQGYDNLDYVYKSIQQLNQCRSGGFRITGDVLVTNLNRITQKLTRRKIL